MSFCSFWFSQLFTDLFFCALHATGPWSMRRVFGMVRCRVPIAWWQGWTPSRATSFSLLYRNYNSKDFSLGSFWTKAIAVTRYKKSFWFVSPQYFISTALSYWDQLSNPCVHSEYSFFLFCWLRVEQRSWEINCWASLVFVWWFTGNRTCLRTIKLSFRKTLIFVSVQNIPL